MAASSDLPAPLVPADVDLRDFQFMPLDIVRLFGSTFHARASDAEWRAGLTLWCKSWHQVPAGSLPTDDIELCRLAELGRDLKTWRKLKAMAMHGWFEATDGRQYHAVVAEKVTEAWKRKCEQKVRTLKARIAAMEKRLKEASDSHDKQHIERLLEGLRQSLSQTLKPPVTDSATAPATATNRQGQGQGDSKKGSEAKASGAGAPAGSDPTKSIFDDGIALLVKTGTEAKQARSVVGQWRKKARNDQRVADLIKQAVARNISNPVEWFGKALSAPAENDPWQGVDI